MNKIDWDKPLRSKRNPTVFYDFVAENPNRSGAKFICAKRTKDAPVDQFNEYGAGGKDILENIPAEPEREEGWYSVIDDVGDKYIWRWDNQDWQTDVGTRGFPSSIGSRVYLDHEYRPAAKFPPPMDGTSFVLKSNGKTYKFNDDINLFGTVGVENYKCTYTEELVAQKALWRPVQP